MAGKIILLGATGYAGGLALEAMTRRGIRPIVVGKREDALRDLAARHGDLEWRLADVSDPESIRALITRGDVLVTTVGPFDRLGRTVARVAAEEGAHYVDSTGEVGFVRHLREEIGPIAQASGSVMLPAFGYDYVPGLLAAGLALAKMPQATQAEIAYVIEGSLRNGKGMSQGTRRTVSEELGRPVLVLQDGVLTERIMASESVHIDGTKRHQVILAPGTEVLFLPRHGKNLENIAVYNGWMPTLAGPMRVLSQAAAALRRHDASARVLSKIAQSLIGPAGGPDAAERANARGGARAIVRDGSNSVEVRVMGPNMYDLTAELMAWAAKELSENRGQTPGVVDGIEAFGFEGFTRGAYQAGLVEN